MPNLDNLNRHRCGAGGAIALALLWLTLASVARGDGGGLGNLTYAPGEVGTMLRRFDDTFGTPQGQGFVGMHRGYLLVPFSADGGGGNGSGGFAVYDVSDPRNVAMVFTTQGKAAYNTPGLPNYAGDLREPHGYSVSGDIFCFTTNLGAGSGLEFWDLSNIDPPSASPTKIGKIVLPLAGGDYAPSPWWVFWQGGRYAYVAGTSGGLFIVDASDPANPILVKQIPVGALGGFRINTVFAIGNLMVIAMSDDNGITTLDISDPANPVVLDTLVAGPRAVGYSMMVNGNRVLGANDPARVWDITTPTAIAYVAAGPNVADKGGYGTFQDGVFHYGSSTAYVKLDIASQPFTSLGTHSPTGFPAPDWDFATVLGNLTFMGNDHAGSALIVHQAAPDATGPAVNMISPRDGSVNVATTSRVGVTFTDQIDLRSVDAASFIVRPLGGDPLPGRYSHQTGIVNFWPDAPLEPDTVYRVEIPSDDIRDYAGNVTDTDFVAIFSTGDSIDPVMVRILPDPLAPKLAGEAVAFDAETSGSLESAEFSWDFGDGTPATPFAGTAAAGYAFAAPGHYPVRVTARFGGEGGLTAADSALQTIHRPTAATTPTRSSTVVYDAGDGGGARVWCVNVDNDSITAIDAATLTKLAEISVGRHPRTLAQAPDGRIWVACQDDDTIDIVDPATQAVVQRIDLDYGAGPFGVAFTPDGAVAYATLHGKRQVLKLDAANGAILDTLDLPFEPRGIAIGSFVGGDRLFVTRFKSDDDGGEIAEISDGGGGLAIVRTFTLAVDPGPDREDSGRGLPNYVSSIAVSPDLSGAWIPSKKDNIQRGLRRDGLAPSFESSVRTIVSRIDLDADAEDLAARIDFNDADMASAAALSPLGDYVFVALQGTNEVRVIDAYDGAIVGAVEQTGLSPQGLAIDPAGQTLYVHNFMSRTVRAYAIGALTRSVAFDMPAIGAVSTVAAETLGAQVLLGKQVFHNADDPRMNRDRYLSCATCHLDGGQDRRVWDFSDRGEGLRNTITLQGRGGTLQGRVHWSANFDEIHDFENDIRGAFNGAGFMANEDFAFGDRADPLGSAKAGVSPELDALAAYVSSLTTVGRSSHRQSDGSMTAAGELGRAVFNQLDCYECHGGAAFTDSADGTIHNVGTLTEASGLARGYPIRGIDTPTLRGVWATAPYLHHGGAATLDDVLTPTHGVPADVSETDRANLVAYLLQIDDAEPAAQAAVRVRCVAPADGAQVEPGSTVELIAETEGDTVRVDFRLRHGFADGDTIGIDTQGVDTWSAQWANVPQGEHTIVARAFHRSGAISISKPIVVRAGVEAAFELKINFQLETEGATPAPIPEGYLPDYGNAYGPRGGGLNYGWSAAINADARYRHSHPDLRYDTLLHMQKDADRTWEIGLPNGDYTVRLVMGDPSHVDQVNSIAIETDFFPDPDGGDEFDSVEATVTVADGRLTIAPALGSSNAKVNFIEIVGHGGGSQSPTASLVLPADQNSYPIGRTILVHADAHDPGGSIEAVTLYVDDAPLAQLATFRPFFWNVAGLAVGPHTLRAEATDDEANTAASADVVIYVTGDPIFRVRIEDGAGSGEYTAGTTVDVTADTPAPGWPFRRWTGDTAGLVDDRAAQTELVMPAADVLLQAFFASDNSAGDWMLYE
jgi:YVTN family beta-propeller protein